VIRMAVRLIHTFSLIVSLRQFVAWPPAAAGAAPALRFLTAAWRRRPAAGRSRRWQGRSGAAATTQRRPSHRPSVMAAAAGAGAGRRMIRPRPAARGRSCHHCSLRSAPRRVGPSRCCCYQSTNADRSP
jgi:hypothetical protein